MTLRCRLVIVLVASIGLSLCMPAGRAAAAREFNMHITSPADGVMVTGTSFRVSRTFDVAVAGTIEVTVVMAGASRTFTGSATGAATGGPVQVDFSKFGLPVGSCPATISAVMLGFVFPHP